MTTETEAIQTAKTWCMRYNISINSEVKARIEKQAHTYHVLLNNYMTEITIIIDIDRGGVVNDMVF